MIANNSSTSFATMSSDMQPAFDNLLLFSEILNKMTSSQFIIPAIITPTTYQAISI